MINSKKLKVFLLAFLFSLPYTASCHTVSYGTPHYADSDFTDAEKLSRAVDYFQSGKYHEALIWFSKLDSKYKLNPRFQAYIGVCCYYDNEYERAIGILEPLLPKLKAFSPHEQAVYYYCTAESYFRIKKYIDAVPLFEHHLLLCYNDEKGDSLYRIGLCYKHLGDIENAQEYFVEAMKYFRKFNNEDKLNFITREIERNSNED